MASDTDLLDDLAEGPDVDRDRAELVLRSLKNILARTIASKGSMTLPGIGTFTRVAVPAINAPVSGSDTAVVVEKPAEHRIVFDASEKLQEALDG